jgi:hypothetical protein
LPLLVVLILAAALGENFCSNILSIAILIAARRPGPALSLESRYTPAIDPAQAEPTTPLLC